MVASMEIDLTPGGNNRGDAARRQARWTSSHFRRHAKYSLIGFSIAYAGPRWHSTCFSRGIGWSLNGLSDLRGGRIRQGWRCAGCSTDDSSALRRDRSNTIGARPFLRILQRSVARRDAFHRPLAAALTKGCDQPSPARRRPGPRRRRSDCTSKAPGSRRLDPPISEPQCEESAPDLTLPRPTFIRKGLL